MKNKIPIAGSFGLWLLAMVALCCVGTANVAAQTTDIEISVNTVVVDCDLEFLFDDDRPILFTGTSDGVITVGGVYLGGVPTPSIQAVNLPVVEILGADCANIPAMVTIDFETWEDNCGGNFSYETDAVSCALNFELPDSDFETGSFDVDLSAIVNAPHLVTFAQGTDAGTAGCIHDFEYSVTTTGGCPPPAEAGVLGGLTEPLNTLCGDEVLEVSVGGLVNEEIIFPGVAPGVYCFDFYTPAAAQNPPSSNDPYATPGDLGQVCYNVFDLGINGNPESVPNVTVANNNSAGDVLANGQFGFDAGTTMLTGAGSGALPANTVITVVGSVWDNFGVVPGLAGQDYTESQQMVLLNLVDYFPLPAPADYTCNGDGTANLTLLGANLSGGVPQFVNSAGFAALPPDLQAEYLDDDNAEWRLSGSGIYDPVTGLPFDFGAQGQITTLPFATNFPIQVRANEPWSITFTDKDGCSVTVEGLYTEPEPQIVGLSGDMCEFDPPTLMYDAEIFNPLNPAGPGVPPPVNPGAFFGPGVSTDFGNGTATFDPLQTGPGQTLVTYCVNNVDFPNCAAPICVDEIVSVYPHFAAALDFDNMTVCVDDPEFELHLDPAFEANMIATFAALEPEFDPDGVVNEPGFFVTFSGGVGVDDDSNRNFPAGPFGYFDPATAGAGVHPVTITVGYPACETTLVRNITVVDSVDPVIEPRTVCAGSTGQFDLTAMFTATTTLGGTFTGTVTTGAGTVAGDIFTYDPEGPFPIVVDVTYSVGTGNCAADDTQTLTLEDPLGEVFFDLPDFVCGDETIDASLYLTGADAGATVTWTVVTAGGGAIDAAGVFTPTNATGLVTIRYEQVTGAAGCDVILEETIQVYLGGDPTFTPPANYCEGSGILDLTAYVAAVTPLTPLGTFSGLGVTGTDFDPAGLAGPIAITYCVGEAGTDCEECTTATIMVFPSVDASLDPDSDDFCENDPALNPLDLNGYLSATATTGGVWTDDGNGDAVIEGGMITLMDTSGVFTYTYTVGQDAQDAGVGAPDCYAQSTLTITIQPLTDATFVIAGGNEVCSDTLCFDVTPNAVPPTPDIDIPLIDSGISAVTGTQTISFQVGPFGPFDIINGMTFEYEYYGTGDPTQNGDFVSYGITVDGTSIVDSTGSAANNDFFGPVTVDMLAEFGDAAALTAALTTGVPVTIELTLTSNAENWGIMLGNITGTVTPVEWVYVPGYFEVYLNETNLPEGWPDTTTATPIDFAVTQDPVTGDYTICTRSEDIDLAAYDEIVICQTTVSVPGTEVDGELCLNRHCETVIVLETVACDLIADQTYCGDADIDLTSLFAQEGTNAFQGHTTDGGIFSVDNGTISGLNTLVASSIDYAGGDSADITVTYTVEEGNECDPEPCTTTITVYAPVDAGFTTNAMPFICAGTTLTVTPNASAGATDTLYINGTTADLSTGSFDIPADWDGQYTIVHTVSNGDCTETAWHNIYVIQEAVAEFGITDFATCESNVNNDGTLNLTGLLGDNATPGGSFTLVSALGTVAGNVLTIDGPGDYEVTYSVGIEGQCFATTVDTATITINADPDASFTAPETVCSGATITVEPAQEGGTWGGSFTDVAAITPVVSGAESASPAGLPADEDGTGLTFNLDLSAIPAGESVSSISFAMNATTSNGSYQSEIDVDITSPDGTVFNWDAGDDGGFPTGSATNGTPADYDFVLAAFNGETASGMWTVEVSEDYDDGSFNSPNSVDKTINTLTLTVSYGAASGTVFTVDAAAEGLFTLTYTVDSGLGCVDSSSQNILVIPAPTVETTGGDVCATGGLVNLSAYIGSSTGGGTFSSDDPAVQAALSGNTFDPADFTGGVAIIYAVGGVCSAQDTIELNITQGLTADLDLPSSVCSGKTLDLNDYIASGATGGVFIIGGDTIDAEWTAGDAGLVSITYAVGTDACGDSDTEVIEVIDALTVVTAPTAYVCQTINPDALDENSLYDLTQTIGVGELNGGNFDLGWTRPFITEFDVEGANGLDCDEFIEISGPAGFDLTDWSLVIYKREDLSTTANGKVHKTIALSGAIDQDVTAAANGREYAVKSIDVDGPGCVDDIPDKNVVAGAIALVNPEGAVMQYIGYSTNANNTNWAIFTGCDGPAAGLTTTDVNDIDHGNGTLQFTNNCWTWVADPTIPRGSRGEFNTDMDPSKPGSVVNEFYYDFIAPNGDILNLSNFCWSLFIDGGEIDGNLAGPALVDGLTKNQVYSLGFDYELEDNVCGSNIASVELVIFMDIEDYWTAPEFVCENADEINLTGLINDEVHFIQPYQRTGSFDSTITVDLLENVPPPFISEVHAEYYDYDQAGADDHCVTYNFYDDVNNTPLNPNDDVVSAYNFCEGIEISAPEGTDLSCYSLVFYTTNGVPAGTPNALADDVVYIGEDGIPVSTDISNGMYMELYGTVDNDDVPTPSGNLIFAPQFGPDMWGNYPLYGGANPVGGDPYGTANEPATAGIYVDNGNIPGFYDLNDTPVSATDFPWERAEDCVYGPLDQNHNGVGSRWFPILDLPGDIGGVGFFNHCSGELLEFISWGEELCVQDAPGFSQAGPFEKLTSTVIDTIQNDQLGDLRSLQLISCSEVPEAASCSECQEGGSGKVWVIVYDGGAATIPMCGIDADLLDDVAFSNTIGYYNCELDADAALPAPPDEVTLDLTNANFPDNYIITGHTITVTINGPEGIYTYDVTTGECGEYVAGVNTNTHPGCEADDDGAVNPCIDGEHTIGDVFDAFGNLIEPAFGWTFSDAANNCYIGECTMVAKDTYTVGDLTAYIFNEEVAKPDTCNELTNELGEYSVTITVNVLYEQCFPVGNFIGEQAASGNVWLNEDDLENPYWVFNPDSPEDLTDESPIEITYNTSNANVLTADPTDDLACEDDDDDYEWRTQEINIIPAPKAELTVESLTLCEDADEIDLDMYLGPETPATGVFSGAGISGYYFDPAVAGVGSHTITYYMGEESDCYDEDQMTIHVMPAYDNSFEWLVPVSVGVGTPSVCANGGVYVLNDITTVGAAVVDVLEYSSVVGGVQVGQDNRTASFTIDVPCGATVISTVVSASYSNTDGGFGDADFWTLRSGDGSILADGVNDNVVDTTFVFGEGEIDPNGTWTFEVQSNSFPWEATLEAEVHYVLGSFEGPGVSYAGGGEWIFDPAGLVNAQGLEIKYVSGCNDCSPEGIQPINVLPGNNAPVEFTLDESICNSAAPLALSASPEGGYWTGEGVTGDSNGFWFDPSNIVGDVILTYNLGEGDLSCGQAVSDTITVLATPDIQLPSSLCEGDAPFNFNPNVVSGADGTWSADGGDITDGWFTPAGTGVYAISYTVGGCTDTQLVTVGGDFDADWTTESGGFWFCENELPITLIPNMGGGMWMSGGGTIIESGEIASIDTTITIISVDTIVNLTTGEILDIVVNADTTITENMVPVFEFTAEIPGDADHVAYEVTYSGGGVDCGEEKTYVINVYKAPVAPEVNPSEAYVCNGEDVPALEIIGNPDACTCVLTFNVYHEGVLVHEGATNDYEVWSGAGDYVDGPGVYEFDVVAVNEVCESDATTVTITVGETPDFSYNLGCTDVVTENAAILITPTAGVSPFEVSINGIWYSDFVPTQTLNVLVVGVNEVIIRDANGCESAPQMVVVPDVVSCEASLSCPDADGIATLTVAPSGGTGDYEVSLDGGVTYEAVGTLTFDIDVNEVDAVNIRVRDGEGCESEPKTMEVNDQITFLTEASCPDASGIVEVCVTPPSDGTYTVSVNGNSLPAGVLCFETTPNSTVVVVVSDGVCESAPQSVSTGDALTLDVDMDCPVYNSVTEESETDVTFSTSGGVGSVTIFIDGTPLLGNSTTLTAGTYEVSAVDGSGCATSTTVTITPNVEIELVKEASQLLVCGDGEIVLTVTGAETYEWSLDPNGNFPVSSANSANGVFTSSEVFGSRVYYVVGITADGCESEPLVISAYHYSAFDVVASDPVCSDDGTTYSVTFTISGGLAPYAVTLGDNNPMVISGTTYTYEDIPSGSGYTALFGHGGPTPACEQLVVGDAYSCTATCAANAGTLTLLSTPQDGVTFVSDAGLGLNIYFVCEESTFEVEAVGANVSGGHALTYVVVDEFGMVVEYDVNGEFNLDSDANYTEYTAYAVSYLPGEASLPAPGTPAVFDGCSALSGGFDFLVLQPVVITGSARCDEALGGYVVDISIEGGAPEYFGFGSYGINFPTTSGDVSVVTPASATVVAAYDAVTGAIATFAPGATVSINVSDDGTLCTATTQVLIPSDVCGGAASLFAEDDNAVVGVDQTNVEINLLSNDFGSEIRVTGVTNPSNGTITWNQDGTFNYVPNPGFTGTDVVTYQITDAFGNSTTASVFITVEGTQQSELAIEQLGFVCNETSGEYTITAQVVGGSGSYLIEGDFSSEDITTGQSFNFTKADGTSYSVVVTDLVTGETVELSSNGEIVDCTKVAVELLDFSGKVLEEGNLLNWITAVEINNAFFTLEHSLDGDKFEVIAVEDGLGNSSTGKAYDFLHANAPDGISYYRLISTDFDGNTEDHGVISLVRGDVRFGFTNVYPVPAVKFVSMDFTSDVAADAQVEVYDVTGKLVSSDELELTNKDVNTLTIDVSRFAAGTYFVTVNNGVEVITTKFVKE